MLNRAVLQGICGVSPFQPLPGQLVPLYRTLVVFRLWEVFENFAFANSALSRLVLSLRKSELPCLAIIQRSTRTDAAKSDLVEPVLIGQEILVTREMFEDWISEENTDHFETCVLSILANYLKVELSSIN